MNIHEEEIEKASHKYASSFLSQGRNNERYYMRHDAHSDGVRWALSQPQKKLKTLDEFGWFAAGAYADGGSTNIAVNVTPIENFYQVTSWIDGEFSWCLGPRNRKNQNTCDSVNHGKQLAQEDFEKRVNELYE